MLRMDRDSRYQFSLKFFYIGETVIKLWILGKLNRSVQTPYCKKINSSTKSLFPFLPFLFLFILIVVRLHADAMEGDENRYYEFAQNLLNGFCSPPLS